MPDTQLPVNADYFFVEEPVTAAQLKAILRGVEGTSDRHPVDPTFPTNGWVRHVYAAVTPTKKGYAVLHSIPPIDDDGTTPVEVEVVVGEDEKAKADAASLIVGAGNELIGYEDVAGPQRVVICRRAKGQPVAPAIPNHLSWDTSAARQPWSAKLLSLVSQNLPALEAGKPNSFIAGYDTLSPAMKQKFWAELLVAMAKFESDWDPKNVFAEPPPLGVNSIGLLQLSKKDQDGYPVAPRIENENALKEPLLNLGWGVTIFARLLGRDGVVATSNGNTHHGAARYWSVLRAGHKIDLIKALTKKNVGIV